MRRFIYEDDGKADNRE